MKHPRRHRRRPRGQWEEQPAQARAEAEAARVVRILDELNRRQATERNFAR